MRKELTCLVMALAAASAQAGKPPNTTDAELALAAPYCIDTMGFRYGDATYNTSPRAAHWVSLMGKNFWSMHHYCWAVINLRRAQGMPNGPKLQSILTAVASDYQYVLNTTTADFVLRPEVLTKLGEVELLRGRTGAAYEAFHEARTLRPDYWPPYVRWAEVLLKIGKKQEALELMHMAVRYNPTVPAVAELYRRAGGDPSKVKPIERPASAPAAEPAASAASSAAMPAPASAASR